MFTGMASAAARREALVSAFDEAMPHGQHLMFIAQCERTFINVDLDLRIMRLFVDRKTKRQHETFESQNNWWP